MRLSTMLGSCVGCVHTRRGDKVTREGDWASVVYKQDVQIETNIYTRIC